MGFAVNRLDKQFFLLVQVASSLSLGLLAAVLYSLEQVHPDVEFRVSLGSVAAFGVVAAAAWCCCRLLVRDEEDLVVGGGKPRSHKVVVVSFVLLLAVGMFLAFARSLRNVSASKVREVTEGAAMAGVFLIFLGLVFWQVIRFFNKDHERWSVRPPDDAPPVDQPPGDSSP